MNENELLTNGNLREELVEHYEVLDKVKELLLIPGTEFATLNQVADFYEVSTEAIKKVYQRNKDEFDMGGVGVKGYNYFTTGQRCTIIKRRGSVTITYENGEELKIPNRGIKVFPLKAILKIGLLLQDSVIADKVKQELGLSNVIKINGSREEIKFFDKLEEMFTVMNIQKGIKQYRVLGKYRIDYYMPEFRLAIEYDENGHSGYTYEQHEGRQKEIQKELCCDFVRLDNRDDIFINIAKVFKGIIDYKNDALEFADDFIKYYSA